MTNSVYFDVSVSLDGFIAGVNSGTTNPIGNGGSRVLAWQYPTESFRERMGLPGGETGLDNDLIKTGYEQTGAYIMGRKMFEEGEFRWPESPPFRAPVFVVTSSAREPWGREDGTTFTFVTDGIESAYNQARTAADEKDICISGGANIIQQYIRAGLIDEMRMHHSPVILGGGVRLFDQLEGISLKLEKVTVQDAPLTTHITYRVIR